MVSKHLLLQVWHYCFEEILLNLEIAFPLNIDSDTLRYLLKRISLTLSTSFFKALSLNIDTSKNRRIFWNLILGKKLNFLQLALCIMINCLFDWILKGGNQLSLPSVGFHFLSVFFNDFLLMNHWIYPCYLSTLVNWRELISWAMYSFQLEPLGC